MEALRSESNQLVQMPDLLGRTIGKVQIDYEVLSKPGPLDDREFEHVKAHVRNTVNLLRVHKDFDPAVLAIIAAHHERFDGTGYPRGLEGMSIPLAAEMAGIIDTYCAMTRERVYRGAVSSQRAMETPRGSEPRLSSRKTASTTSSTAQSSGAPT